MKPSTSHATLGDDFFDQGRGGAISRAHPALSQPARGGDGGARQASPTSNGSTISGASRRSPARFEQPLALRYHGHQFQTLQSRPRRWSRLPLRAARRRCAGGCSISAPRGSGRTPWSRMGDGRLTLKGGVREVLATSMLEALGVDTSKSLSLIETGEELERHDEPSPTRASVLVRLSHSHIRIGTLPAAEPICNDTESMKRLLDYSLRTYFGTDGGNAPAETLLRRDGERVAADRRRYRRGRLRPWRARTATTSTSPARASTTARGGSCRPTTRRSRRPISIRTGLYAFRPPARCAGVESDAAGRMPVAARRPCGAGGGAQQLLADVPRRAMWNAVLTPPRPCSRAARKPTPSWWSRSSPSSTRRQIPYEQFWFDWRGGRAERNAGGQDSPVG